MSYLFANCSASGKSSHSLIRSTSSRLSKRATRQDLSRQNSTSRDGTHLSHTYAQNPACAASRSARLPRAAHPLINSIASPSSSSFSVGIPHPPPPGVSIRRRSPLPMRIVAFPPMLISRVFGESPSGASPSSSRPCLIQVLCPSPPEPPPSRPYGARVRRCGSG
jgi:hypothetical protein